MPAAGDRLTAAATMRDRLAKVEALARAAGTSGERRAALAAARRLRDALQAERRACAPGAVGAGAADVAGHHDIDMTFRLDHPWAGRLLTALCHRYAIEPLADPRDGTLTVRAPRVFLETVLAPEFARVQAGLAGLMTELSVRPDGGGASG